MLIHAGIVALEFADLVNDACLTVHAYKKALRDGRITILQKGGHGHPAIIDWASLPERYKEMVRANMGGDPAELVKTRALEQHMRLRPDDDRYIDDYRAENGCGLSDEKRAAKKKAARVMAFLDDLHDMPQAEVRSRFGMTVLELKRSVLDYIKAWGIELPTSFPRLEERKRAYRQCRIDGLPGAASLVHGGHGNKNRSRIVDPYQQKVLEVLAMNHRNLSYTKVTELYNTVAKAQGYPTMSCTAVRSYLSSGPVARAVAVRARGKAAYQDTFGLVIKRSRPTQPTYLWVHDATVYELYYQRTDKGRTTYHHRKYVCVVLDPWNYYPVGYAIGDVDNVELTKAAVKSAVEHVAELVGEYAVPHQVQSDRLGSGQLAEWYEAMGVTYTPAQARNARAKAIESWFGRHHTEQVQPYYPNWGGHNITAGRRRQPNPDALEAIKHTFPNEASVIEQIHEAMGRERASKAQAYREALIAMGDRLLRISRAKFLALFGTKHPWQNELTNRGLCPTIAGTERWYNALDTQLQDHIGKQFHITYDPADLSSVLVSTDAGRTRFLLEALQEVPMALADHTPESRSRLSAMLAFKGQLSQAAIDRGDTAQRHMREVVGSLLMEARHLQEQSARVRQERKLKRGSVAEEDTLDITPLEEAVVRSYATVNGSHKEALNDAKAALPPVSIDPEKWALDNL